MMGWGLLRTFALRRRFRISFLLKVCSTFFGLIVGLVTARVVVGVGVIAVFMA
jgi:hypothetical protein